MIVSALSELNRINVIHRDIKLANILLDFPDIPTEKIDDKFLRKVDLT